MDGIKQDFHQREDGAQNKAAGLRSQHPECLEPSVNGEMCRIFGHART
jgi:hypothetical protein